ncbi:MAG: (d)CMP kinase [Lachnospiraceae bacterium]|jgi:cytidylate kinase|nr:(d)CMP kinase [Lachnospiraceae bacterium]
MSYNIAIDGPAGAGKSTIAKIVAKEKGFIYVDTGAMYRAIAYHLLQNHVDVEDVERICEEAQKADVSIRYIDGEQVVLLNGENVNAYLRQEEVGNMASASSVHAKVREKMTELQRKLAAEQDVVMDGRDIGTVVLPNADLKIFLTASVEERAKRRFDELKAKGENPDLSAIEKDIAERDHRDMTREVAPLKQAEDAVLVDTTSMTIQEVADKIMSYIK